jgi:hypothetical protein
MSDDAPKIKYLNTDLDLVAAFDLTPLASALEARGVFPLHVTIGGGEAWYSTLEVETMGPKLESPEVTIRSMLDAIEALDGEMREHWTQCSKREFNIGYDCGDEPWAYNDGLSHETLKRIAQAGASLRITLYPYRPSDGDRR